MRIPSRQAFFCPAPHRLAESDRELQDPHAHPARNDEMAEFVKADENGYRHKEKEDVVEKIHVESKAAYGGLTRRYAVRQHFTGSLPHLSVDFEYLPEFFHRNLVVVIHDVADQDRDLAKS